MVSASSEKTGGRVAPPLLAAVAAQSFRFSAERSWTEWPPASHLEDPGSIPGLGTYFDFVLDQRETSRY